MPLRFASRPGRVTLVLGVIAIGGLGPAQTTERRFFRPGVDTDRPVWGVREGIRFGVWPGTVEGVGDGGPRGLIRVGYPAMADGSVTLVNFVAIEPVLEGQRWRSFSELEASASDNWPGKVITAGPPPGVEWQPTEAEPTYPGRVEALDGGAARLTVCLRVERFGSGAHVRLLASVRTDRPHELELQAFAEPESAPLAACVLTATMGNFERLRQLQLKDRVVTAQELYPDFTGNHFAPHTRFASDELPHAADSSIIVAATTDEADPAAVHPDPNRQWFWYYGASKLTQYWRKYPGTFGDALAVAVNARRVYYGSDWPIPGGVSYENLELNERFEQGQATVFGLTPQTPEELLE